MKTNDKNIIFFDGQCGLCHRAVRFILARDVDKVFWFASLQSATARQILPKYLQSGDSLVVLEQGIFYTKSAACFIILGQLHTGWSWLRVFRFLPKGFLDYLYRIIAKNRHRLFGKQKTCDVLMTNYENRFL